MTLNDAAGLELTKNGGEVVLSFEPSALGSSSAEGPTFDLGFDETRRMLLDISGFLQTVTPGTYTARVSYGTRTNRAKSDLFAITVRQPTQDERRVLDSLRQEGAGAGKWGEWTYRRRPDDAPWLFLPAKDPLRYHVALNQLLFGPQELPEVDPAVLADPDPVTSAEAAAIHAELLASRGSAQEFERQQRSVRQRWPGLAWWMDRIAKGRSEIAYLRATNRGDAG
jgi:hypothetical protein